MILETLLFGLVMLPSDGSQLLPSPSQTCNVTRPNGVVAGSADPSPGSYGAAGLSTFGLWPNGVVVLRPGGSGFITTDGALGMKFPWQRGVRGELTISGRRLDGDAPPLRALVPAGYGDQGFQATSLIFPTEGCWEVTGRVGDASLTFVTSVVKIGDGPAWRREGHNFSASAP